LLPQHSSAGPCTIFGCSRAFLEQLSFLGQCKLRCTAKCSVSRDAHQSLGGGRASRTARSKLVTRVQSADPFFRCGKAPAWIRERDAARILFPGRPLIAQFAELTGTADSSKHHVGQQSLPLWQFAGYVASMKVAWRWPRVRIGSLPLRRSTDEKLNGKAVRECLYWKGVSTKSGQV
jgi:hypothetical protein